MSNKKQQHATCVCINYNGNEVVSLLVYFVTYGHEWCLESSQFTNCIWQHAHNFTPKFLMECFPQATVLHLSIVNSHTQTIFGHRPCLTLHVSVTLTGIHWTLFNRVGSCARFNNCLYDEVLSLKTAFRPLPWTRWSFRVWSPCENALHRNMLSQGE